MYRGDCLAEQKKISGKNSNFKFSKNHKINSQSVHNHCKRERSNVESKTLKSRGKDSGKQPKDHNLDFSVERVGLACCKRIRASLRLLMMGGWLIIFSFALVLVLNVTQWDRKGFAERTLPGGRARPLLVDNSLQPAALPGTPDHHIIVNLIKKKSFRKLLSCRMISNSTLKKSFYLGGLANHLHVSHAGCLISTIVHLPKKVFVI